MSAEARQIFIVSTGRCGSTLLSQILSTHPEILSLSEIFMAVNSSAFVHTRLNGSTFWKLLATPRRPMNQILTPQTCPNEFRYDLKRSTRFTQTTLPPILYMALPSLTDAPDALFDELAAVIAPRPDARLADHYQFMFDWLANRFKRRMWVERSGASLIFVETLAKMYPKAKFIHLFRDGRDTALSIRSYPPLSLLAQSWHDAKKFGVDLLKPPFRLGDSKLIAMAEQVLGPLHGVERRLANPADLETVGKFWSAMITTGLQSLDKIDDGQKFSIRYESLVSNPHKILRELVEFIDPSLAADDWIEHSCNKIRNSTSRQAAVNTDELGRLSKACMPGLRALGYPHTIN